MYKKKEKISKSNRVKFDGILVHMQDVTQVIFMYLTIWINLKIVVEYAIFLSHETWLVTVTN